MFNESVALPINGVTELKKRGGRHETICEQGVAILTQRTDKMLFADLAGYDARRDHQKQRGQPDRGATIAPALFKKVHRSATPRPAQRPLYFAFSAAHTGAGA